MEQKRLSILNLEDDLKEMLFIFLLEFEPFIIGEEEIVLVAGTINQFNVDQFLGVQFPVPIIIY